MSESRRCILLVAVAALAAGSLLAAPVLRQVDGVYQDTFQDASGLVLQKNVSVGPTLTPGVRVSLADWSWAQSYTPASQALWTPFDDSGATLSLVQVIKDSATAVIQSVGLWQETFRVSESLTLAPGIAATTYIPISPQPTATVAVIAGLSSFTGLPGRYAYRGPLDNNLVPTEAYTATFKAFFCDNPPCTPGLMTTNGAELGFYEVAYGNTQPAQLPIHAGAYSGVPAGEFFTEGVVSPVTLEWTVPFPLPPGDGWEYRLRITMTWSGLPAAPACAPECAATVWADTVTVMAKGRRIPPTGFVATCPAGQKPCGVQCIPIEAPCGWDAATLYVSSGSYLSPVFDSLSNKTVWQTIWWDVNQNYNLGGSNGYPRTPVAIKWRVGDSLDPSTWLPDSKWFDWTIPNSVTCSGERADSSGQSPNCQPNCSSAPCDCSNHQRPLTMPPCVGGLASPYMAPMRNQDTASLYTDGVSRYAVGRYFQYAVDLSGQFGNDKYPPQMDTDTTGVRELHDAYRPQLKAIRVSYQPARGQVVSNPIRPSQLLAWKDVTFTADTSSGGGVNVDVLDEGGVPLFTNVPSGFSLAGLDPAAYPALRLRASIDNGGIRTQRPSLISWEVHWTTFTDPLLVTRNSFDVSKGEVCTMTVVIPAARPGKLAVYDAAGQLVRTLFQGVFGYGVSTYSWDGRNEKGDKVATGVYFIALHAKDLRRMKRVAVSR